MSSVFNRQHFTAPMLANAFTHLGLKKPKHIQPKAGNILQKLRQTSLKAEPGVTMEKGTLISTIVSFFLVAVLVISQPNSKVTSISP